MATNIRDVLRERPIDRSSVDSFKKAMANEVRAYRLREIREALSLTQVEMASRLHVSQNRVSRIEHGDLERTQVDTLRRYVEALGGNLHLEVEFDGQRTEIG